VLDSNLIVKFIVVRSVQKKAGGTPVLNIAIVVSEIICC